MKKKYDLSILIPARNEEFLSLTVKDILKNKRGNTEIIVGLDGNWAKPHIEDNPDVTIFYSPVSLGQRGMGNQLCRLSNAHYIAKVDAHCAFDEGFDIKMLEAFKKTGDNVVMLPIMRNLHVFDWVCEKCGYRMYQGPTPDKCPKCGGNMKKEIVWHAKESPQSISYCFDTEPHFQYFKEYAKRDKYKKDLKETGLTETMSIQGSFFMMSRKKYWELNIDDENFGSWGSQGIQVACSFWLSGGKVLVNHNTWYAHLFRTKGDFSFPYPQSGRQVQHAKSYAKDLFFNGKYKKQIYPLSWLLKHFYPVRGWTDKDIKAQEQRDKNNSRFKNINIIDRNKLTKEIIFYTDNQLNLKIAHKVQDQLRKISKEKNIPIISVSLKPMEHFGNKNIFVPLPRSKFAYFTQILMGLENSKADIVFMAEHDVLYSPTHFDFIPERDDKFYYDLNWWRIRAGNSKARHWDANQVSMICANRKLLLNYYRNKIIEIEKTGFGRSYEPGGRDKNLYENWWAKEASIDIRHQGTMTRDKLSPADFRDKSTCINWQECDIINIKGWDNLKL